MQTILSTFSNSRQAGQFGAKRGKLSLNGFGLRSDGIEMVHNLASVNTDYYKNKQNYQELFLKARHSIDYFRRHCNVVCYFAGWL